MTKKANMPNSQAKSLEKLKDINEARAHLDVALKTGDQETFAIALTEILTVQVNSWFEDGKLKDNKKA